MNVIYLYREFVGSRPWKNQVPNCDRNVQETTAFANCESLVEGPSQRSIVRIDKTQFQLMLSYLQRIRFDARNHGENRVLAGKSLRMNLIEYPDNGLRTRFVRGYFFGNEPVLEDHPVLSLVLHRVRIHFLSNLTPSSSLSIPPGMPMSAQEVP